MDTALLEKTYHDLLAKLRQQSPAINWPGDALLAASKGQPPAAIEAVKKLGITHFGENYVQEAESKRDAFLNTTLHLIGHLQKNKARKAAALFDVIDTVDSPALARALNSAAAELGKTLTVSIQVNIGLEPQKHGAQPNDVAALVATIRNLPHLKLQGFMAIPPDEANPTPYFQHLKSMADQLGLQHLSMGMSHDWALALAAGATQIRIGTTLFGPRKT